MCGMGGHDRRKLSDITTIHNHLTMMMILYIFNGIRIYETHRHCLTIEDESVDGGQILSHAYRHPVLGHQA